MSYVRVKTNLKRKDEGERSRYRVAMVEKAVGIHLQTRQGLVRATHIDSDGLSANYSIHPRDILLTVNGIAT